MVNELRLFRFVDGVSDTPFPNKEANDEQIVITSFTYNAQRMAATPTITASINYPRCLDNDWDVNVYATFNNEKYYIRQIPSSSKDNTNVMYKHDLTLYSERFVLENIYFTDIEKKKENGIDVFVKRETTSIIYRFNLIEYVDRLNWSLEASNLPYRVSIDSSILNSDKAKEIKDVSLENAYLANAIQEIYNQWETFFYFNGNNIIIKDCSENINDVVLEYGAVNSLLSIKKNNANFRKITRISGYGSDKNIPFYYPNWSQKGVIDAMPLSTNSKLTKGMITISDMKKFDKKMPLNGNVKYFLKSETQPIYENTTLNKDGLKYQNQTSTKQTFSIPFETIRENDSVVDIYFDVDIYEEVFPTINSQYLYYDIYNASGNEGIPVLADKLHSPVDFGNSFLMPQEVAFTDDVMQNTKVVLKNRIPCTATLESSAFVETSMNTGNDWKGKLNITRKLRICLTCQSVPKGKYNINIESLFNIADAIKKQEKIGYYYKNYGTILQKQKDYFATLNQEKNFININLSNFSIVFPESDADEGWYLNETKKIELADIGISVNGTPDDSWNGEGFTQEIVSKIPTAQNLMPSLYRNSIGERKFYNAINYPRSAGSNDQDGASGETLNGLMYENDNYKENGSYYNFETLWTPTNQNEHIQDFEDIYPSITNITNANGEPIDEILEVAFDDNDNNEVDEEGNYIHPYFYVRIPKFDGNNGFNLFDHKIVGGNMQVAMTSGDCAACNFEIMVKTRTSQGNDTYEDVVNPIKLKENGTLVDGDSDKKTAGDFGSEDATQQDSRNNSIWLVLKKDNQTFNEAYPNKLKGVVPKVGDKFVLLNIDMPRSYVLEAEEKLTKEIVKYMSHNNSDKWNFDIDFSRIFLQENQDFYSKLDENCKLNVRYNGVTYNFYVNNYKYEVKSNEALPKITVGLVDTITVNRGVTQNIVDGVMKAIQQTYDVEESVDNDALYFRKSVPETITQKTTFDNDVDVNGNLNVGEIKFKKLQSPMYGGDEVLGTGFKLEENENGESTLTVDNVNVRKKLKATESVIQQIHFQGGIVIQSAAAMECNQVETLDNGNFKCYFDTKEGSVSNQFMLDDLARCQRVGYAPKYYWRKVVEVGSDYIVLSNVVGEYEEGSDSPSEGDIIVQMGNTTNTNRQSAIEMNTVGENSPSFIMYSGISTFSLLEKDTTGIVYHQKVVDENGNVTLEAYPELYSYGSMYFGDRKKQNNFIQFAPNANGTFEMLINAKTSFKGGTSDLGTALEGLLNGVDNLQQQVDGEKTAWFLEGMPTPNNKPASDWTTEELRQRHEGDTYTNINTSTIDYINNQNIWESGSTKDTIGNTYEQDKVASTYRLRTKDLLNNNGEKVTILTTDWQLFIQYYNSEKKLATTAPYTTSRELNKSYPYYTIVLKKSDGSTTITPSMISTLSIVVEGKSDYDPTAGQSWRWCNVDDEYGIGWHWHKIADSDAVKALKEAGEAQQKADKAQTDATNAQNRMNNWASDSNFSKLEQQGLDDERRRIEADESDITIECTKYSLLEDTTYTEYEDTYEAIITQLNSVVESLNTNDYIAIPTDFTTNHETYYIKRTAVLERISDKADEVANAYADKKVGEIEIGGRNLLKNSKEIIAKSVYKVNNVLQDNTNYVISCKNIIKSENSEYTRVILQIPNGAYKRLVNEWDGTPIKFNTKGGYTILYLYGGNPSTSEQSSTFYNIKLEEGNKATSWTPAPEDVDAEIADTMNAIETLNDDSIFQQSEKLTIRKEWEEISGTAVTPSDSADVTISTTYGDSGSYKKTLALIPSDSGISTTNIDSKIETLRSYLNKYKLYRNNKKFSRVGETDPAVVSDFSRSTLAQYFQAYYNEESNIIKAVNDYFAKKQIQDLQIGGVNLLTGTSNAKNWTTYGASISLTNGYIKINFSTQNASTLVYMSNVNIKANEDYVLSFNAYSNIDVDLNFLSVKNVRNITTKAFASITTSEQYFTHKFKVTADTNGLLCLGFNPSINCSVYFKNIQLEKGNKATAWKPNDADIIEARENILKDAMLFTLNDRALQIDLTKSIEPNTEYVFSLENNVLPTNTNSVKVRLYDDPQEADYWEDTYLFEFNITSGTKFAQTLIFNASISKLYFNASISNVTLVGVKLAEGNTYTGWEGTPDEQQALITLNNAMKSSTDIIGGLVMTNLIGMKGYGTEASQIKAGISGLNENNNLRFWAGSTAWSNANTAPFRVYDDGRVFGTHFYGYNSFFKITSSNMSSYVTNGVLDLKKTGSRILLDLPNNSSSIIQLPHGTDYLGVEIEIVNLNKTQLAFCNKMPDPTLCNINNMFDNVTEINLSGYYRTDYYWKLCKTSCSIGGYNPTYCKFIYLAIPMGSTGFTNLTNSYITNPTYYNAITSENNTQCKMIWVKIEDI